MSIAGRCIALSTSSGIVVGPGMARNSRPARTVIAVLPYVMKTVWRVIKPTLLRAQKAQEKHAKRGMIMRGARSSGHGLSSRLAASGSFGFLHRAEPAGALADLH